MDLRLETPSPALSSAGHGGDLVFLSNGQIELDNGLRTAIHLSLFCDRLADEADVVPREFDEPLPDRRGYWADFLSRNGHRLGSRLYLLRTTGAILTAQTEAAARGYCLEALAWIEARGIGTVEVEVERIEHGLVLHVDVVDSLTGARRRHSYLWDAMVREGV